MSDDAPRGNPGVDPDDLDISKSEYVRELGDDRYVVSPGRRQPQQPAAANRSDGAETEHPGEGTSEAAATDADTDAPGDLDVASTAESVREGLSPTDAPGAAGPETDASSSPAPSTSQTSSTDRTTATAGDPSDDIDDPSRPSQPPAAGTDDRLPGGSTGGDESGADGGATASERPASHARRGAPRGESTASPSDLDAGAVGEWLAASLADTEFAYGFDATLLLDGRTARHRMASDDVGETFETLVTWFADAAGGDTPTEDAIGILLAGMDTSPRLPPNAVRSALAELGVSRDDSVEDVLAALEEAGGLRLE
ncbi:DUF7500 family protein [Halobaculum halobium]|uniref:Uncharacterized protein n=2 Tax=Halobaculum halobium TaxID=3032281 RepID=A0ABD5TE51_9EURY|nr:hypothetical protein [Halobaculum sp. SYNS20]